MLPIDISRRAQKFLKTLPPKHGRQVALKLIELQKNPRPHDSIQMKGKHSHFFRTDVGEYRIIYFVEENVLKIVLVGKRNDGEVYKQLKNL